FCPDSTTTAIHTLSLHDALPIWGLRPSARRVPAARDTVQRRQPDSSLCARSLPSAARRSVCRRSAAAVPYYAGPLPALFGANGSDRKSTRLNSSHVAISYAVFCL